MTKKITITVYEDKDQMESVKDILIDQKEFLLQQGVFFVPRGDYFDIASINYKEKMFNMQKLVNGNNIKSLTLYDFNCENEVLDCLEVQKIKVY